ncbi:hypothetical protein [Paraburkholderia kururiensis]|uniref:Uncharacterized protein n=1 Tax=Paraburkholderia kururiensis TaxID=984307 RepID=A0ABZ0WQ87_9BURK|nr:hypothetical protein [Paraburkholderia kururiensis]WQD79537.1 hypothetical protein U0042_07555 [Paraburkholderia kururiensis]
MTALDEYPERGDFAPISAQSARALAVSMDESGFGVLNDIVPASVLATLRRTVSELIEHDGFKYFALNGAAWCVNTCLGPLFDDVELLALLRQLYMLKMGVPPPSDRILPVMRVLAGTQGRRHSCNFHYDSYVVSILLPVLIPCDPGEPPGHLVMFPNLRNARRSPVVNIFEKLLIEKLLAPMWRLAFVQKALSAKVVTLTPGNLYFFWGMRSLHANQACAPSRVRCTVLLHFGDPHERSVFKGLSQRLHAMRLRRMTRA